MLFNVEYIFEMNIGLRELTTDFSGRTKKKSLTSSGQQFSSQQQHQRWPVDDGTRDDGDNEVKC